MYGPPMGSVVHVDARKLALCTQKRYQGRYRDITYAIAIQKRHTAQSL
jgi:hypothetical protein